VKEPWEIGLIQVMKFVKLIALSTKRIGEPDEKCEVFHLLTYQSNTGNTLDK
jgi:hypothetical protein